MKQLILIIGLIAMICACQPTAVKEMTPEERQEIATTIKQTNKEFFNMLKYVDQEVLDSSMDYFVENNDEAWMNNPAIFLNGLSFYPTKEAMYENWKPEADSHFGQNIYIDDEYVAVLSHEYAVYVLMGSFTIIDEEDNEGEKIPFSGSYVYALRNGKWKFLHTHQSWTN